MPRPDLHRPSVYFSRPYHAPIISDDEGEDDDVCVWQDELLPGFDSDDETPLLSPDQHCAGIRDVKISDPVLRVKKTENPKLRSQASLRVPKAVQVEDSNAFATTSFKSRYSEGTPQTATVWAHEEDESEWEDRRKNLLRRLTLRNFLCDGDDSSEGCFKIRSKARMSEKSEITRSHSEMNFRTMEKTHQSHTKPTQRSHTSQDIHDQLTDSDEAYDSHTEVASPPHDPKYAAEDPFTPPPSNNPDPSPLRSREIEYAFSATRRNMTHISQFMLKLEARAGKTSKEGIRSTLDATVNDKHYDLNAPLDYGAEILELKHMTDNIFTRLFLLDRHWRRVSRGTSSTITMRPESEIKEWIRVELQSNPVVAHDECYFTAMDVLRGRSFEDWMHYLRTLGRFREDAYDEMKLVELAWLFLDRNLRGPRPGNPTTAEQFVAELEERRRDGVWEGVLRTPMRQVEDDAVAWGILKRHWTSRPAPL